MGQVRSVLLGVAVALLLAVRTVTPFGFMPGDANGRFAIVECPDAQPDAHAHHGMDHGSKGKDVRSACPFAAGMVAAGPLPAPPILIAPPSAAPPPAIARLETVAKKPEPYLRPPSRAPPSA